MKEYITRIEQLLPGGWVDIKHGKILPLEGVYGMQLSTRNIGEIHKEKVRTIEELEMQRQTLMKELMRITKELDALRNTTIQHSDSVDSTTK